MTLPATQRLSAKWADRRVGIYGGSFNPAHDGHLHVALSALKHLPIDDIWFLVSPGNPQKTDDDMASYEGRMASVKELIGDHPRLHASSIERDMGIHYSADTLDKLQNKMPKTRFLWVMGADNLASFHTWHRWEDIIRSMPIAVFDRPGYGERGLRSFFALKFARLRTGPKNIFNSKEGAWTFVTIPRHPASASKIRAQLRKGNRL